MEKPITISVVIPAYNAEKYIARAIESVLRQNRKADEVIVVDDGSTDGTGEAVRRFGESVVYIHQENAGASAARNAGIRAAQNEWIALLDGDDEWLENHLETHRGVLERNRELVWSTGAFIRCECDDDVQRLDPRPDRMQKALKLLDGKEHFDYFEAFVNYCTGWTGTMVIKKTALVDAEMFSTDMPRINDIDMWMRIANLYPEIGFVSTPTAIYHEHVPGSIVKTYTDKKYLCDFIDQIGRAHV